MLRKQNGFSMVQVIIAAGMMAALSLGMMKIIEMQNKASKKSSQDLTITSVTMEMNSYLAQAEACGKSLVGVSPGEVFDIKDRSGKTRYTAGKRLGNLIEINEISLKQSTPPVPNGERGVLNVKLKLSRLGKNKRSLVKMLKVMATLDASGAVESCESYETDAIETGIQRSCESIGGIFGEGECHFEDALVEKLVQNTDFMNALASNPAFVSRFASSLVAAHNQAAIEATRDSAAAAAASNLASIEATNKVTSQLDRAMDILENSTEADLETMQASQKEAMKIIGDTVTAVEQNRLTSEDNNKAIVDIRKQLDAEIMKLDELKGNLYKISKAQENVVIAKQSVSVATETVSKYQSQASSKRGISGIIAKIRLISAKKKLAQAKQNLANAESYLKSLTK